jgi:hypothetical protein
MDRASANPFLVSLICVVRCLVPLLIMLGISYLLKKFGLISEPPEPPEELEENHNNHTNTGEGGLAHGNV